MDGRDIGMVVFLKVEFKIFFIVDLEIRVCRRYDELIYKGQEVILEEVKVNLIYCDCIDFICEDSFLWQVVDVVIIDNILLNWKE